MTRPNARRIVAAMKNPQSGRDFSAVDYPRSPMRKKRFMIYLESPIAIRLTAAFPRPAFRTFPDGFPKYSLNRPSNGVAVKTFKSAKLLSVARMNIKALPAPKAFARPAIPSRGVGACAATILPLISFNFARPWVKNFPAGPATARACRFHSRHLRTDLTTTQLSGEIGRGFAGKATI